MRKVVFTYDFPHYKTTIGLLRLVAEGYKPNIVLGAPRVKLNFYKSKTRLLPCSLPAIDPAKLCEVLGIAYQVMPINDIAMHEFLEGYKPDVGIILGSRILDEKVISSFKTGILNMHPGLIPENRGLDNILWAINNFEHQGVTTHLISKEIDKGRVINKRIIPVYSDDELYDMNMRNYEYQLNMMIDALRQISLGSHTFAEVAEDGVYNKSMRPEEESTIMYKFEYYKWHYDEITNINKG